MRKIFAMILAIGMLLSAVACDKYEISISVKPINPTEAPETEPTVTEPTITEPTITEPTVTEPTVTEPTVTEPPATEPTVTEPSATEPMVNSLSVDKANVDEMNKCLSLYASDHPENFGVIKMRLCEYGWSRENDFAPQTIGYSFLWNADKNIVLLADANNCVVYPIEYTNADASNKHKYFDLSLPAFLVEKETNPAPVKVDGFSSYGIDKASIVVKYDFTAPTEYGGYYNDWIVDFYLSCDLLEGVNKIDIGLIGTYERLGYWDPYVLINIREGQNFALWGDIVGIHAPTLEEFQDYIRTLSAAIIDPEVHSVHFEQMFGDAYDDSTGATLNVELRLTNPADSTDYVVVSICRYTF